MTSVTWTCRRALPTVPETTLPLTLRYWPAAVATTLPVAMEILTRTPATIKCQTSRQTTDGWLAAVLFQAAPPRQRPAGSPPNPVPGRAGPAPGLSRRPSSVRLPLSTLSRCCRYQHRVSRDTAVSPVHRVLSLMENAKHQSHA